MAICPAGHQTTQTDFCDTCGLPVPQQQAETRAPTPVSQPVSPPVVCPHCQTPNVADALFCEACGYDFTTGAMPASGDPVPTSWQSWTDPAVDASPKPPLPADELAPAPAAGSEPASGEASTPDPDEADTEAPSTEVPGAEAPTTDQPEAEAPTTDEPELAVPEPEAPATALPEPEAVAPEAPAAPLPSRPVVEWVAELWIDPDWYTAQGSTDPMPSQGLPDIVPLVKASSLIGRVSNSRGIFPEVDCDLDSGCSRRHAMLTTDGTRWWIEDLNSANGTFVGAAAGTLPAMPIPQGRVELSPGQRIYVGAWTRIVIRRATDDERDAFAG